MVTPSGDAGPRDEESAASRRPAREDILGSEAVESQRNRKQAALYSMPFLLLGVGNVVLILTWGLEPLWAFVLLPPILFTTVLTYIVFSTDFLDDR